MMFEGGLEVKLPTIWTDGKAEVGSVREEKARGEKIREEKEWEERRCRCAKKVEKSRFTAFFHMICGSGGWKSRLAKAAGAEPAGQMRDEKLHAVVARSTFRSQNVQNTSASEHFWKLRCRKSARCCARVTFPSQIAQSTPFSDHVWKLRCRKSARRCAPLLCEAHFQVKMVQALDVRTTFWRSEVEKVHVVLARSTFPSQKCRKGGHWLTS